MKDYFEMLIVIMLSAVGVFVAIAGIAVFLSLCLALGAVGAVLLFVLSPLLAALLK